MKSVPRRRFLALGVALSIGVVAGCGYYVSTRGPGSVGQGVAPAFSLPDQNGTPTTLAGLLANGPAVLVFYRGFW
ncbi:MAG: hypothetical protein IPJ34_25890 [Myxococcales bacterium]|nr:hypothetical protein [Myxococcales bacterium]